MTSQPAAEARYRRHNSLPQSKAHLVESVLAFPKAGLPLVSLALVVAGSAVDSFQG